jgi:hypothetical protein
MYLATPVQQHLCGLTTVRIADARPHGECESDWWDSLCSSTPYFWATQPLSTAAGTGAGVSVLRKVMFHERPYPEGVAACSRWEAQRHHRFANPTPHNDPEGVEATLGCDPFGVVGSCVHGSPRVRCATRGYKLPSLRDETRGTLLS